MCDLNHKFPDLLTWVLNLIIPYNALHEHYSSNYTCFFYYAEINGRLLAQFIRFFPEYAFSFRLKGQHLSTTPPTQKHLELIIRTHDGGQIIIYLLKSAQ